MDVGKYTYQITSIDGKKIIHITIDEYTETSALNEAKTQLQKHINNNYLSGSWNTNNIELVAFEKKPTINNNDSWMVQDKLEKIYQTLLTILEQGKARL